MEENKQNSSEPHVQIFGQTLSGSGKKENKDSGQKSREEFEDEREWRRWRRDSRRQYRDYYHYHHHHGNGVFGAAVLLAGVLLLLNTIGAVSWEVWNYIWPFWPVIIVLIGLRIVLGHNWAADGLIFLIGFALFIFIILYGLVHANSSVAGYLPEQLVNFINNFKPF
jgi:hypothetical protein